LIIKIAAIIISRNVVHILLQQTCSMHMWWSSEGIFSVCRDLNPLYALTLSAHKFSTDWHCRYVLSVNVPVIYERSCHVEASVLRSSATLLCLAPATVAQYTSQQAETHLCTSCVCNACIVSHTHRSICWKVAEL